jgi:hypothetical protein
MSTTPTVQIVQAVQNVGKNVGYGSPRLIYAALLLWQQRISGSSALDFGNCPNMNC